MVGAAGVQSADDDIGSLDPRSAIDDLKARYEPRDLVESDQALVANRGTADGRDIDGHILDAGRTPGCRNDDLLDYVLGERIGAIGRSEHRSHGCRERIYGAAYWPGPVVTLHGSFLLIPCGRTLTHFLC